MNDNEESVFITDVPLGGSALSLAIQSGRVPREWDLTFPSGKEEWIHRIERCRESSSKDWLDSLKGAFAWDSMHPMAKARLQAAADDGVVVTTGQQPGLFGGPAYTITKALSALAFADEASALSSVNTCAVFWAATDDSDWNESAVVHVVGKDGLEMLRMSGPATEGISMNSVSLGDVSSQLSRLREASGSVADYSLIDILTDSYSPNATVGSAFLAWLRSMLEPLGIPVLDASHPDVRSSSHETLRNALLNADVVDKALNRRVEEISDASFKPQVERVEGLSLVFHTLNGIRSRVAIRDAQHIADTAESSTLGSNVLMRPVLERKLLPTIAYMAGPGELAYFAQATAVARALDMEVPMALPRCAFTWREARIDKILERIGIEPNELKHPHITEGRIAREAMPDSVVSAINDLRDVNQDRISALKQLAVKEYGILKNTVAEGLYRDISQLIDRTERRILAEVKRQQHSVQRDISIARASIFPNGTSPERILSLVPVLARYGRSVLDQMTLLAREHALKLLSGEDRTSVR